MLPYGLHTKLRTEAVLERAKLEDNRHGLAIDAEVTQGGTRAERDAPGDIPVSIPGSKRVTLGGDKGYDVREFVELLRMMNVTPHIAGQNASPSAIVAWTTRHPGYAVSQREGLCNVRFSSLRPAPASIRGRSRHPGSWLLRIPCR